MGFRGKKQCPKCGEYTGVRSHVCPKCNHAFSVKGRKQKVVEPKPVTPVTTPAPVGPEPVIPAKQKKTVGIPIPPPPVRKSDKAKKVVSVIRLVDPVEARRFRLAFKEAAIDSRRTGGCYSAFLHTADGTIQFELAFPMRPQE